MHLPVYSLLFLCLLSLCFSSTLLNKAYLPSVKRGCISGLISSLSALVCAVLLRSSLNRSYSVEQFGGHGVVMVVQYLLNSNTFLRNGSHHVSEVMSVSLSNLVWVYVSQLHHVLWVCVCLWASAFSTTDKTELLPSLPVRVNSLFPFSGVTKENKRLRSEEHTSELQSQR